jgi:hypothetical protein
LSKKEEMDRDIVGRHTGARAVGTGRGQEGGGGGRPRVTKVRWGGLVVGERREEGSKGTRLPASTPPLAAGRGPSSHPQERATRGRKAPVDRSVHHAKCRYNRGCNSCRQSIKHLACRCRRQQPLSQCSSVGFIRSLAG